MDYLTKPTSRIALRQLAPFVRALFGVDSHSKFPVLDALEKLPDVFPGSLYTIVQDYYLPADTPARCRPDEDGNFVIEIKESVYNGAYYKNIGAYRGFIMHEICHIFLYKVGFTPIYTRSFENNRIPAYCSVEWQTKALCGEIMMPYAETRGMCRDMIISTFGVSKGFAEYRLTY